jgi:thymidylate kinase
MPSKFLIEGLDFLGKSSLVNGILHKLGYYQVLHFSKPLELDCYEPCSTGASATEMKSIAQLEYQKASFRNMFTMLYEPYSKIICDRAHLGECVYAPLYRGYSGDYVFDLEKQFTMDSNNNVQLILLTEDFDIAEHFIDDGASLGPIARRREEQELFLNAFGKSQIKHKRTICVTDQAMGGFKSKTQILAEALA